MKAFARRLAALWRMPGIFVIIFALLMADCIVYIVIGTATAKTICSDVIYGILGLLLFLLVARAIQDRRRARLGLDKPVSTPTQPVKRGRVEALDSERYMLLHHMLVHVMPGVAMYAHQDDPRVIITAAHMETQDDHLKIRVVILPTLTQAPIYTKTLLGDLDQFRIMEVNQRGDALSVRCSYGSIDIDERTLSEEAGVPHVVLDHIDRAMEPPSQATALEVLNGRDLFMNLEKNYRLIWHSNAEGNDRPNPPDNKTAV